MTNLRFHKTTQIESFIKISSLINVLERKKKLAMESRSFFCEMHKFLRNGLLVEASRSRLEI